SHPDGSAYGVGAQSGDVAFLFPGQGSQYLQMGGALAMAFDVAREPWDRAANHAFGAHQRIDQVVFPTPKFTPEDRTANEDRLRATEWAQPAIGTTSLSYLSLMNALGIRAQALAGHSFGEITALHAAGVLTEVDLLRVARRRGELMAAASEQPGAMTAISADIDQVRALLTALCRTDVVIANHNAPTQVVLSGTLSGIEAAETQMQTEAVRFKRLDVATAFHSPVVASSKTPFDAFLSDVVFSAANLPVWSGESAAPYEAEAQAKRNRLAQQIAKPVHFVDLIKGLSDTGIRTFVEVGPGSVLTALVDTLSLPDHRAIALDRRGKDGMVSLSQGIAQLIAAGISLDLRALWQGYGEPEDVGKRTKPRLVVPICGANHGKIYPPEGGAAALPGPNPPRPAAPPLAAAPTATGVVEAPVTTQSTPSPLSESWLAAWQEAQRQNAMAHTAFQQAMAQSHTTYLNVMETSIASLASLAGGTAPVARPLATPAVPAPITTAPAVDVVQTTRSSAPTVSPTAIPTAPVAAPVVETPTLNLHALMLAVVAEKTGYPAEMLDLTMNLEGDLGIDSIKRVEILAAVQEQAPGMPEVDAAQMGALGTLGEIVDYMQGLMGTSAPSTLTPPPSVAPKTNLGRYALELVPSPALGLALPALHRATEVLVTRCETGLADALVAELQGRNVKALAVDAVPAGASAVIFLGGLRPINGVGAAMAVEREGFAIARTLAPN
ncbi:MAG: acyltransferase domain-containing protein, partial [Victivallales bacterium]|nr:acyltransferase domain-containing protein [Victivallales bacterium]